MTVPLIKFENVSKAFDNKTVLRNTELELFEGEITTIIGKSGGGKSVLLKHIIGLMEPDQGKVFFRGKDIARFSRAEKKNLLCEISYMFQNNALFDSMTLAENIAFPLEWTADLSKKDIAAKVRDKMVLMELTDAANKYPSEVSGGMQKRAALCRALITEPAIVLFDEPTTGQDVIRRNAILGMIAEYQKKYGFTAVIISHDIPDILYISNRVLVLHEGRIVFQGTPEELDAFRHPFIDEFIDSVKGFRKHLSGTYSRHSFNTRYNTVINEGKISGRE